MLITGNTTKEIKFSITFQIFVPSAFENSLGDRSKMFGSSQTSPPNVLIGKSPNCAALLPGYRLNFRVAAIVEPDIPGRHHAIEPAP